MAETVEGCCELCGREGRVKRVQSELNPADWWLECVDPTNCAEVD